MTRTPEAPGSSKLGYAMIVLGIIEVALAIGLAALTGQWWVVLLGLLAIPNFYVGLQKIRA